MCLVKTCLFDYNGNMSRALTQILYLFYHHYCKSLSEKTNNLFSSAYDWSGVNLSTA